MPPLVPTAHSLPFAPDMVSESLSSIPLQSWTSTRTGGRVCCSCAYAGYTSVKLTTVTNAPAGGGPVTTTTTTVTSNTGIGGYGNPAANNTGCSTEVAPTSQLLPAPAAPALVTLAPSSKAPSASGTKSTRAEGWFSLGHAIFLLDQETAWRSTGSQVQHRTRRPSTTWFGPLSAITCPNPGHAMVRPSPGDGKKGQLFTGLPFFHLSNRFTCHKPCI